MLVSKELKVGLVFFLAICVFLVFAISLGSISFGKKMFAYEVVFDHISGLSKGDEVKVNGMRVGAVANTELITDGDRRRVLVTIAVDRELEFCEDYSIIIEDKNMVGGQAISIELGDLNRPMTRQDRLEGVSRSLGEIPRQIDPEMVKSLLASLQNKDSAVGVFMHDAEIGADLKETIRNIRKTSEKLSRIAEQIGDENSVVNKFLEDEEMYDSLSAIVADTEILTAKLRQSRGMLRALDDDKLYRDIGMAVSDMRDTAESIKLLAEEVRRDPQLFLLGRDSGRRSWLIQQLRGQGGAQTKPFVPRDSRKLTPGGAK